MARPATGKAPSQRQLRVGELVRHPLAEILQRGDVHDPALEGMVVTVPEVRMSPDLRLATVYVMPLGGKGGEAAVAAFDRNKRGGLIALAAFAFSPLSSAQLFAAAGLAAVPLLAFTAAFFAGRLLSYSFYAASAKALQHSSIGESFQEVFSSPLGIAIQVLLLAALVAFTRINWERILGPAPEHADKPHQG